MFGGGTFGGGFGQQPQQPAFGAPPAASPFGAPAAPAFGQQQPASPFGATTTGTGLFGSQAPAFGAAPAAPAFGSTTTGFGTTGFGATAPKPAGFGFGSTPASNPFGATTQTPAFGAASTPAFGGLGSAPSFGTGLGGATGFGASAPAFGAASAPAFGAPAAAGFGAAASAPAFGASAAPAFGGFGANATAASPFGAPAAAAPSPFGAPAATGFGASAPAFGAQQPAAAGFGAAPSAFGGSPAGGLFGGAPAASPFGTASQPAAGGFSMAGGFGASAAGGTRSVAWTKTRDQEGAAGQPATFFMSISAMPNFAQPANMKSHEELRWEDYQAGVKGNTAAGAAPTGFGTPAAPAAGGFGFGGTTSSPGAFGAPAAPSFGAAPAASLFGAPTSAPAFGQSSTPAFGAASTPAFGAASSPSLFGGATTGAAFGSTGFGASSAPAFGGFGAAPTAASAPSMFGAASGSAFGTSTFGASPFGAASSAGAFGMGSTPSLFGASAAAASPFGAAPASAPSPFGASGFGAVASPFGASNTGSAFGTSTFGAFGATAAKPATPFGASPSPFGATAPATGAFSFSSTPATGSLFGPTTGNTMSFGSSMFGQVPGATANFGMGAAQPPAQPPSVSQPAYGAFNSLPAVAEPKVGLTTRPARNTSISSAAKASPLLSLRPTPVRYGAQVPRGRSEGPAAPLGAYGSVSTGPTSSAMGPSTASLLSGSADGLPGGGGSASAGGGLLPLRSNPHRLFIAAPPPSTEAAGSSTFVSPVRAGRNTPGRSPDGLADGMNGGPFADADGADGSTPPHARPYENGGGYTGGSAGANGYGGMDGPSGGGTVAVRGHVFQDAPASEPYLPRLGRLVHEGYSFSPNPDELRLLHSQNPSNLAKVSNFTVTRERVGQVRWVVPVDVRGLDLAEIISIEHGEVALYTSDPSAKPPVGVGLNQAAEVTLYSVYRKDKDTGALLKEGPRAQAYEKALRQMCARMGARFLVYKLEGGVWKFEVEHFSRYGLIDIDDDEEEVEEVGGAAAAAAAPASRPVRKRTGGALGLMSDADMDDGASELQAAAPAALGRAPDRRSGGTPAASGARQGDESEMEPSVRMPPPEPAASDASEGVGGGHQQAMSAPRALPHADGTTGSGVGRAMALVDGSGGVEVTMEQAPPAALTGPLQHTLLAGSDPVRMRAMHDAFFGSSGGSLAVQALEGGGGSAAGMLAAGPPYFGGSSATGQARAPRTSAAAGRPSGAGAAGAAGGRPAVTSWNRPTAAVTAGAAGAVLGRGMALAMEGPGARDTAGYEGSPITLALARPLSGRTAAATFDDDVSVLPLRDVRSAGLFIDAGLGMGRAFRVGWGPGGTLVMPGTADASRPTELCIVRVRAEGEAAAYGDDIDDAEAAARGLEGLRERLRAALQVHLAASAPVPLQQPAGDEAMVEGGPAQAHAPVPHWRLRVTSQELPLLVEQYAQVCEQQLQQLAEGGGSSGAADVEAEVARLRHQMDTWALANVLFSHIDGELPDPVEGAVADVAVAALPAAGQWLGAGAGAAGDEGLPAAAASADTAQAMDADGSVTAATGAGVGTGTMLAAMQRRAQLSLWLQRQAKPRVEEALGECSSVPQVVLQLLSGRQMAAAAGAAAAAGDVRLATLIAQAGVHGQARADLESQLQVWERARMLEHMDPERTAIYRLLAGEVLDTQRLLSLDWRRLLALHLWYATPATASPAAAVQAYMVGRQMEPLIVPHPAPLHAEGLQPAVTAAAQSVAAATATAAATDVQWELMQLWATTPAATTADCLAAGMVATAGGVSASSSQLLHAWLENGGCSRLLRNAGYSANPLDYSLGWHLMTVLQSLDVLPHAGSGSSSSSHADQLQNQDLELLQPHLELITQLQLAGSLCEWALYVALHIPDLPAMGGTAVREALVRELLACNAHEWVGSAAKEAFLADTLDLPAPLLAEARAMWAHYCGDHAERCVALLEAGQVEEAHAELVEQVAPQLFLSARWQQLAELACCLEPYASRLPGWSTGAGLYASFLSLFGQQLMQEQQQQHPGGAGSATMSGGMAQVSGLLEELLALAQRVQAVQQQLKQQDSSKPEALRQRLVLSHIAVRVQTALMFQQQQGAKASAGAVAEALQNGLALGCVASELQLGGLAVAVAAAASHLVCS